VHCGGTLLGHVLPGAFAVLASAEVAKVNLPVAVLIWLMIIPMLLKVDFRAMRQLQQHWKGIGVTLFINWAVKPFSMALLGWLFLRHAFADWLPAAQIDSYIAGLILLAAAPCTAMVFVWSNLCRGDANFTLSQVALNDAIMVVAYAPVVALLLGLSAITVPWDTLLLSVGLYIVVPVLVPRCCGAGSLRSGEAGCSGASTAGAAVAVRAAADAGAAVRVPGPADREATAGDRADCGADPDPGLFHFRPGLPAQPSAGRGALRGRPFGADWRQQLLRTGGGDSGGTVRRAFRGGAGDGGGVLIEVPVMLSVVRIVNRTQAWYERREER
jgi:ACR3 family arsenite transporter